MFGDHVLVLNSDNDVISVHGLTVSAVRQGHLRLGIRASPWKRAVKAEFAHPAGQGLREGDSERHPAPLVFGVAFGFVAGIAKHEPLVASSLVVDGLHHASVDVGGLAGNEFGDFAQLLGGGVHADAMVYVADVCGGFSSDSDVVGGVNASSEFDFTGQNDV